MTRALGMAVLLALACGGDDDSGIVTEPQAPLTQAPGPDAGAPDAGSEVAP